MLAFGAEGNVLIMVNYHDRASHFQEAAQITTTSTLTIRKKQ
jgi:hypothetical protein